MAGVARADVADVAAVVLRDPAAHAGATYELSGPEALTLAEIAARAGAVLGRPLSFHDETVEEAYASRASYGAEQWQLDAWVSTYTAIANGEVERVTGEVERITGQPARTLEQALSALDRRRQPVGDQAQTSGSTPMPRWVEKTSTCSAWGDTRSMQASQDTIPSRRENTTVSGTGSARRRRAASRPPRRPARLRAVGTGDGSEPRATHHRRAVGDHPAYGVGALPRHLPRDHATQAPADQGPVVPDSSNRGPAWSA